MTKPKDWCKPENRFSLSHFYIFRFTVVLILASLQHTGIINLRAIQPLTAIFTRIQLSILWAIYFRIIYVVEIFFFFSVWDRRRRVYFYKARTLLQRPSVLLPWILDREMGRRLILHKIEFTRWRFFTSYFIVVETFCFWIDLVRVLPTTGNTSAVAGYTRV